jgi:SAM-dependent methyltransferase
MTTTEFLRSLRPSMALDVGCGCGDFTRTLVPLCQRIVAVDVQPALRSRWKPTGNATGRPTGRATGKGRGIPSSKPTGEATGNATGNRTGSAIGAEGPLHFCCMDARTLGFATNTFPVVFERASLHHMAGWETAVAEMFRVSADYVLLEEEVDDPRTVAKQKTIEARRLFLELQHEVGYPHFAHLDPDRLLEVAGAFGEVLESGIDKRDDPVDIDHYFEPFPRFVERSRRPRYWHDRLRAFRENLGDGTLCESDVVRVLTRKRAR